jgi:hypothetical protein
MNNNNNKINSVIKRQLLFIGGSLGLYFMITYFFGFLIAFIVNTALFVVIMFYIRKSQLRSFEFTDERGEGGLFDNGRQKLKYTCLSCGTEVHSLRCTKCGSKMKKPLF